MRAKTTQTPVTPPDLAADCASQPERDPQPLPIDRALFVMAFAPDVDYHDVYSMEIWLDRRTGDVLWLYECDGLPHYPSSPRTKAANTRR